MTVSSSIQYVKGWNKDQYPGHNTPHYLVDFTEWHLSNFETLSSLISVQNYENMLSSIEFHLNRALAGSTEKKLIVPPYDVWLVIMTISTVTTTENDAILRESDVYNFTKISLNKRALKLMRSYLDILTEFDTELYNRYDLELLRCQLFLALDAMLPQGGSGLRLGGARSRNTRGSAHSPVFKEFSNPYSSYRDCLVNQTEALGSKFLHLRFAEPGEMINTLLLTLSNSILSSDQDDARFLVTYEAWIPIFTYLFEIILLRQNYFICNEVTKPNTKIATSLFVQILSESPSARFLSIINAYNFSRRFIENVFIDCPDSRNQTQFINEANKNSAPHISSTYIRTTDYTEEYTLRCSMELRRKLVLIAFHFLSVVPSGHRLVSPRLEINSLLTEVAAELVSLTDLSFFTQFLWSADLQRDVVFIPIVIEAVVNSIISDDSDYFEKASFNKHQINNGTVKATYNPSPNNSDKSVNFVNCLNTIEGSLAEYSRVILISKPLEGETKKSNRQMEFTSKLKICWCVLAMTRYAELIHSGSLNSKFSGVYKQFLTLFKSVLEGLSVYADSNGLHTHNLGDIKKLVSHLLNGLAG